MCFFHEQQACKRIQQRSLLRLDFFFFTNAKSNKRRFLFNVGEGTQRLCMEHRIRLSSKAEHAFFTKLSSDTLGGVPGEGSEQFETRVVRVSHGSEYSLRAPACFHE